MDEQLNQNQPQTNPDQNQTTQPTSTQNQSQPQPEGNKKNPKEDKDIEENKLWAFLGYLGILCLVPLLAKKDSKFAQFHAKQGLILAIGEFFIWIPFVGWILGIFILILWIIGLINVFSGKMKPLPLVGEMADKINI